MNLPVLTDNRLSRATRRNRNGAYRADEQTRRSESHLRQRIHQRAQRAASSSLACVLSTRSQHSRQLTYCQQ